MFFAKFDWLVLGSLLVGQVRSVDAQGENILVGRGSVGGVSFAMQYLAQKY